jgi:hypothetical protein
MPWLSASGSPGLQRTTPSSAPRVPALSSSSDTTATKASASAPVPESESVGSPRAAEGEAPSLRSGPSAATSPRPERTAAAVASPREVLSPSLVPPARPQSPQASQGATSSPPATLTEPATPAPVLSPRMAGLASPRSAVPSPAPRDGLDPASSPASPGTLSGWVDASRGVLAALCCSFF